MPPGQDQHAPCIRQAAREQVVLVRIVNLLPGRLRVRLLAPGQTARIHVHDAVTGEDTVVHESSDVLLEITIGAAFAIVAYSSLAVVLLAIMLDRITETFGSQAQRRTLRERCERAAALVNAHDMPAVCWTNLNAEADLLTQMIEDAVNVQGSDTDEQKEHALGAFANGSVRVIVSKPTIAGFGLNWQHCAHMTFFPSHSFEQYYQGVRRCWRFGQTRKVYVDVVTSEGEAGVLANMNRKASQAETMFARMVELMNNELHLDRSTIFTKQQEIPAWL